MPELPEVETMVRGIRGAVEGARITGVVVCPSPCRPLQIRPTVRRMETLVRGRTIAQVRRRAKRVVLQLDDGSGFAIEPRMTGLMLLADPPNTKHLRFEWRLSSGRTETRLWFWDQRGLGTITLHTPDELSALLAVGRIGKDALEMTPADWAALCCATSRPIKVLLLDQQRVAGIGNLYASEILHLSRISPLTPANLLAPTQIRKMSRAVISILEEAIRHEGSTLSDGTYRNALNVDGGYQNSHRVYDREEELCPTCRRGRILRIVQAQRSTFYCPRCQ